MLYLVSFLLARCSEGNREHSLPFFIHFSFSPRPAKWPLFLPLDAKSWPCLLLPYSAVSAGESPSGGQTPPLPFGARRCCLTAGALIGDQIGDFPYSDGHEVLKLKFSERASSCDLAPG